MLSEIVLDRADSSGLKAKRGNALTFVPWHGSESNLLNFSFKQLDGLIASLVGSGETSLDSRVCVLGRLSSEAWIEQVLTTLAAGGTLIFPNFPLESSRHLLTLLREQRIEWPEARVRESVPLVQEKIEKLSAYPDFVRFLFEPVGETGADPALAPFVAKGRDLFMQRQGQLNLSCANCHDDNWDKRLAGSAITQAHPTGYPIYRLEWQSLGSLQHRLRGCISGIRAQPYDYGAPELVELELYLMSRAKGMPMEAPAVRP